MNRSPVPASYPDVDENVRAKEGGKETTGPSHGSLRFITSHSFRARLCYAKNKAPEEEAGPVRYGFRAGAKAIRYSENVALHFLLCHKLFDFER